MVVMQRTAGSLGNGGEDQRLLSSCDDFRRPPAGALRHLRLVCSLADALLVCDV